MPYIGKPISIAEEMRNYSISIIIMASNARLEQFDNIR